LIERTVEICRDEIAAAGHALTLSLAAAEHHVEADPARFQQIVWNLIKNAVKFTTRPGEVTVRTSNRTATSGEEGNSAPRLVVEVCDSGVEIEPTALESIFKAFEQGRPIESNPFGGLGLGLSIGRSLAEALGGRLVASSAGKDQGATFTLDLPTVANVPAPASPEPPKVTVATVDSLHILLVEDNEDTLRVMSRLLQRRGYRVSTASCLAAAKEVAREPFDLLVSDIGLPDGTGLDLLRHLSVERPVPAIALSGFGMEEDLRKSREAGFLLHLIKPVDFPALEAAIRTTLAAAS
jgi:CheY-like chemotaxis protein